MIDPLRQEMKLPAAESCYTTNRLDEFDKQGKIIDLQAAKKEKQACRKAINKNNNE